jgi:MFS family permease
MSHPQHRSAAFHGWWLVGALFAILFFAGGGGLYVFPIFIESLQEEFGWSMTQISAGAGLFAIFMGLSNPIVGVLFARFGARRTMLVAAGLSTLSFLGLAALLNLWMLYTAMVIFGFGIAGTSILPAQTLVTNWFNKYRGRAMGLTMLGIGAGGFLLPPFNEFLIRLWGWRFTWLFSGVGFLLIVVPLVAIFVRTRPSDLGLLPDGAQPGEQADSDARAAMAGLPVKQAVGTPTFWLIVSVFLLQLTGVSALTFHFVPFATQEARFPSQEAALFYGLTVGFSMVGRLLFGWLADRWGIVLLTVVALLLLASGAAILEVLILRLGLREVHLLWSYSIPFGIGIGANAVLLPVLVGRCFGELHFSKIMGLVMSGFAVGIIIGIPVAGRIFDVTGSYEWVLILCGLALFLAAGLAAAIRPERHRPQFVTEG